jgi:diguanylate cyclase (GGDEF)-like protein
MSQRLRLPRNQWGTLLLAAAGVYFVAFVVWQFFGRSDPDVVTVVADTASLPMSMVAAVLAGRVACTRSIDRRTRRAWAFIAGAFVLNLLGDAIWFLYEVVWGKSPFPSPADAPYLLFYVALFAGLLVFPVAPRSKHERRTLALDVGAVLVAASMAIWYLVLGPTAVAEGSKPLTTALSMAYPVGDLVLLFGIATVMTRGSLDKSRTALTLLLLGIAAFVVSDVAFGSLSLNDAYRSGDWPDTLAMLATLLVAASAWEQRRDALAAPTETPHRPAEGRVSPLPSLAIAAVWGMVLYAARDEPLFPLLGLLVGGLLVTLVVLARQLLAVREHAELMEMYQELAGTDVLTGLANRRRFVEEANERLEHASRAGTQCSLLMVDVDRFKQVNDDLGHAAGDAVLKIVANRLRGALRDQDDLIGRFGGDEFVVLLADSGALEAEIVASRLRTALARVREPTALSISVGVATLATDQLDELLRSADSALYEAKEAGRDCARVYAG